MNGIYLIQEIICIIIMILYVLFMIDDIRKKELTKLNIILSSFVLIIMITCIFFISPAFVSGPSMEPTLHDGNIILLNKVDKKINRFDIIVFYSNNLKEKLIKRAIGLPGETIEIKNGNLYINNKIVSENFSKKSDNTDFGKITVSKGEYFVMGDNRPESLDSRSIEVGNVSTKYILGKAVILKK